MTAPIHSPTIHVLILEDNPDDLALMVDALRQWGYTPSVAFVGDREGFLRAFSPTTQLVLSDYALPQWTAEEALQHVREHDPHLPFLLVTGHADKQTCDDMLDAGATDIVLKDQMLGSLGISVQRALREAVRLREREQLLESLQKYAAELEDKIQPEDEAIQREIQRTLTIVDKKLSTIIEKKLNTHASPGE